MLTDLLYLQFFLLWITNSSSNNSSWFSSKNNKKKDKTLNKLSNWFYKIRRHLAQKILTTLLQKHPLYLPLKPNKLQVFYCIFFGSKNKTYLDQMYYICTDALIKDRQISSTLWNKFVFSFSRDCLINISHQKYSQLITADLKSYMLIYVQNRVSTADVIVWKLISQTTNNDIRNYYVSWSQNSLVYVRATLIGPRDVNFTYLWTTVTNLRIINLYFSSVTFKILNLKYQIELLVFLLISHKRCIHKKNYDLYFILIQISNLIF
jgi:hypothetical protein